MNSISWNVGHLAWQEQQYFVTWPSAKRPFPDIDREFVSDGPASTPPLQRVLDAWRAITAAADPWLDTLTSTIIDSGIPGQRSISIVAPASAASVIVAGGLAILAQLVTSRRRPY